MPRSKPALPQAATGALLISFAVALPVWLLWSSWSAYRMQERQRETYLRSRLGALAARLETFRNVETESAFEILSAEEPGLVGLQIRDEPAAGDGLEALWEGRQLFLLEEAELEGRRILRGSIPFHCGGRLCVARIELSAEAAEFLMTPARRNLAASAAAAAALALLSALAWRAHAARQRALLRQAEMEHLASIGRMSSVLAHEIRNPLGTIKGFAQLIEESAAEGQKRLAAPIVSETARLERLVNDLLAYGRPREPQMRRARLQPLVEQAVEEHKRAGFDSRIDWRVEPGGAGIEAETDPELLRQILDNLLRNAAEAAAGSAAAEVRVAVYVEQRRARIEVRDNGPGFSEEALRRAFEPFQTTKAMGTGLGLAICRRLARLLGGDVEVGNLGGGGAVATLRLPLAQGGGNGDAAPEHRIHS